MKKINLSKLADRVIQVAGPVVLAAVLHKLATGKFDLKGAAIDAVQQTLGNQAAG